MTKKLDRCVSLFFLTQDACKQEDAVDAPDEEVSRGWRLTRKKEKGAAEYFDIYQDL